MFSAGSLCSMLSNPIEILTMTECENKEETINLMCVASFLYISGRYCWWCGLVDYTFFCNCFVVKHHHIHVLSNKRCAQVRNETKLFVTFHFFGLHLFLILFWWQSTPLEGQIRKKPYFPLLLFVTQQHVLFIWILLYVATDQTTRNRKPKTYKAKEKQIEEKRRKNELCWIQSFKNNYRVVGLLLCNGEHIKTTRVCSLYSYYCYCNTIRWEHSLDIYSAILLVNDK